MSSDEGYIIVTTSCDVLTTTINKAYNIEIRTIMCDLDNHCWHSSVQVSAYSD